MLKWVILLIIKDWSKIERERKKERDQMMCEPERYQKSFNSDVVTKRNRGE